MTITTNNTVKEKSKSGVSGTKENSPSLIQLWLTLLFACFTCIASKYSYAAPSHQKTLTQPLSTAPIFLTKPSIDLDPNLSTPLAGLLTFTTDIPARVILDISNRRKHWQIHINAYSKHHSLPVLGFFPNETHSVTVHAINHAGVESTYPKPLSVTTDELPTGFPTMTVTSQPTKMEPGLTLAEVIPEGHNSEFGAAIIIVDNTGNVVWYQIGSHYTDVRQLENGNLLFIEGNKIVEMDMLGNHIHEWQAVGKSTRKISAIPVITTTFHHEAFPMANGHLLSLSVEAKAISNFPTSEKKLNAAHKTAMVAGDVVVEFTQNGKIVHQWHMLDILDPRRIGHGSLGSYWNVTLNRKDTRDWAHGNAVIYEAEDNSIIYSSRHQDVIAKFSRNTGKLIWLLGPHENWDRNQFSKYLLKPTNDDSPYFYPYHQHAPEIMPNGHILLYDNGSYGASPFQTTPHRKKIFSRVVEYAVDEKAMTVTKVWEFGRHANPVRYSGALGDADFLPKTGNVLLVHGSLQDTNKKFSAEILEVTHTQPAQVVFKMEVTDQTNDPENGWRVYRSEKLDGLYP